MGRTKEALVKEVLPTDTGSAAQCDSSLTELVCAPLKGGQMVEETKEKVTIVRGF